MYFDSHAHFSAGDVAGPVDRARESGLAGILAVGGSGALNAGAVAAARHARGFVGLALGWDRSQAERVDPETAAAGLAAESARCRDDALPLAAVGEMGLDYHYEPHSAAAQRALFERQVALASEWRLPVVVHSREADDDTLAILRAVGSRALAAEGRLGVLHCFTGGSAFAEALLELGMCVSFSGILTFRNADTLREVARHIPADRLLVETDCPYLTPVPLRGRPNEPAFVAHVGRCLAVARGVSEPELAVATTAVARRLFT